MVLVPVYDGRESFSLTNYWAQKHTGTVEVGTTVCLLFSMKTGKLTEDARSVQVNDMIGVRATTLSPHWLPMGQVVKGYENTLTSRTPAH